MPRAFAIAYVIAWGAATLAALAMVAREPRAYGFVSAAYLRNLLTPWKIVSFLLGAGFFVLAAPYTGDPTWDRVDGAMMSGLTYLTAPWAIGAIVRARRGLVPRRQVFVAVVLAFLSASWCYDGYLFARDGRYPETWWANIPASGALYVGAGMMWSLSYAEGRGIVFDFQTDAWFSSPRAPFRKIAIIAIILIVGVILAMMPFVLEVLRALR